MYDPRPESRKTLAIWREWCLDVREARDHVEEGSGQAAVGGGEGQPWCWCSAPSAQLWMALVWQETSREWVQLLEAVEKPGTNRNLSQLCLSVVETSSLHTWALQIWIKYKGPIEGEGENDCHGREDLKAKTIKFSKISKQGASRNIQEMCQQY